MGKNRRTHDPLDPAAGKARAEEKAQAERDRREVEDEDIRWLMGQVQGRRIMSRILSICGVYRSSFTGNSETFFREGMRNVGLVLLGDVQRLTPEDLVKLLQEQHYDHSSSRAN